LYTEESGYNMHYLLWQKICNFPQNSVFDVCNLYYNINSAFRRQNVFHTILTVITDLFANIITIFLYEG